MHRAFLFLIAASTTALACSAAPGDSPGQSARVDGGVAGDGEAAGASSADAAPTRRTIPESCRDGTNPGCGQCYPVNGSTTHGLQTCWDCAGDSWTHPCTPIICGGAGQSCCPGTFSINPCDTGSQCISGTCQACGGIGQPCCPGNSCNSGDYCYDFTTCQVCNAGTYCFLCDDGSYNDQYACSAWEGWYFASVNGCSNPLQVACN
jgi:hypothetical protein